jgi:hypothetical protein
MSGPIPPVELFQRLREASTLHSRFDEPDKGGASPAARRRSTPEQDEVLDRMHTPARAG